MRKSILIIALMGILTGVPQVGLPQAKAPWQEDIDWAANDTGAPDCPWEYLPPLDQCLALGIVTGNTQGNRACVINMAIIAAKNGAPDQVPFLYTLVTQCHNPTERQNLINAGPAAIANYLRTFK